MWYHKPKWQRKYLKIAKALAEDNTACFSRKIGVVLIGPDNESLAHGYNGAFRGCPEIDGYQYLSRMWDKLLTPEDKDSLSDSKEHFLNKYIGCRTCPRRILNIPSGQRLELCPCAHAERNALANANRVGVSTKGSIMFCYCGVPCHECANQIIQAGCAAVVCQHQDVDYSPSSRMNLEMAGIELITVNFKELDV